MELVLLVERLLSLLIVCNVFCCYSLLSEIAESSQCMELVLLVESLLSEIAEFSQCVELVLLVEFAE